MSEDLLITVSDTKIRSFNGGEYLAGFSNLKSLDISQQSGFKHGLSQLPQGIQNLNLSDRVIEERDFKGLFDLRGLRTLNLTDTKEWIDKGEKADIIRPLPEEWITALKANKPGFVIVR